MFLHLHRRNLLLLLFLSGVNQENLSEVGMFEVKSEARCAAEITAFTRSTDDISDKL